MRQKCFPLPAARRIQGYFAFNCVLKEKIDGSVLKMALDSDNPEVSGLSVSHAKRTFLALS